MIDTEDTLRIELIQHSINSPEGYIPSRRIVVEFCPTEMTSKQIRKQLDAVLEEGGWLRSQLAREAV